MVKFKFVGIIFSVAGLIFIIAGFFISYMAQGGLDSLQAVYRSQNVMMTYDENGNFTDRGTVEGGDAILKLLTEDWEFPLNKRNMDPNDPLVNTPDEMMVQYARITTHTIHGTQNVVLDEDVEYDGEVFTAGTYEFPVDGRYWLDFDRSHPIEGKARGMAWTGTTHGVLANLAAGTVTHNFAFFVLYFGYFAIGLGLVFLLGGIGILQAIRQRLV